MSDWERHVEATSSGLSVHNRDGSREEGGFDLFRIKRHFLGEYWRDKWPMVLARFIS